MATLVQLRPINFNSKQRSPRIPPGGDSMAHVPYSREFDRSRRGGPRASVADFRYDRRPKQKALPPDQTHAESFYYLKQMDARTPMVVVLGDGEEIRGWIEWYDRDCLKIHRHDGPNVLVPKHSIKYLFKESESSR
ncbi:MAG TPA: hypothetical protein VMS56_06935 [Thermoanaerobaculia bacterium]|nr:hypothetical protein [Thermoanaerobaculia bacterium]